MFKKLLLTISIVLYFVPVGIPVHTSAALFTYDEKYLHYCTLPDEGGNQMVTRAQREIKWRRRTESLLHSHPVERIGPAVRLASPIHDVPSAVVETTRRKTGQHKR